MKKYLFAPGPTPIPPEVIQSMSDAVVHHRAPDFLPILEEVREGLKWIFQCNNEVLIFASSGTGAMEGAVTNTLSRGDRALVVRGGKFGERWTGICQAYGVEAKNIDVPWGEAVDPSEIKKALQADPGIKAVLFQASETSTGVAHPVKEIAGIVRNYENTLCILDAITGIGVFDIPMDKWGIDIVVGGSQKALMLPAGLAFAAVSDKAWKFVSKSNLPKYYFNFNKELKNLQKNQTAYTPAVTLILGLRQSLRMLRAEGLEGIFARHETLASATRAAVKAMGLELFAKSPSNAVTAVNAPQGVDGQKIVKGLRDKFKITIAGGQDKLKGKIFRIAHLGFYDRFDIIMILSAIESVLKDLGFNVPPGKGADAAQKILDGVQKPAVCEIK
ncbi:MAG TPA: alanine--glyoxylate aminotransferase family protein [bacterium]